MVFFNPIYLKECFSHSFTKPLIEAKVWMTKLNTWNKYPKTTVLQWLWFLVNKLNIELCAKSSIVQQTLWCVTMTRDFHVTYTKKLTLNNFPTTRPKKCSFKMDLKNPRCLADGSRRRWGPILDRFMACVAVTRTHSPASRGPRFTTAWHRKLKRSIFKNSF